MKGWIVGLVLMILAAIGYTSGNAPSDHNGQRMLSSADCNIKGNISHNTGERIYHVPGQKYYDATRISPERGERWFCSEDEARRAGWRKSRV